MWDPQRRGLHGKNLYKATSSYFLVVPIYFGCLFECCKVVCLLSSRNLVGAGTTEILPTFHR